MHTETRFHNSKHISCSIAIVAAPTASSTGYPFILTSTVSGLTSSSAPRPSSSTSTLMFDPSSSSAVTASPPSCQGTSANLAAGMLPAIVPLAILFLLLVVTTIIIAILAVVLYRTRR